MGGWIIGLVAVVSSAICLFLWFRDVRRVMTERKSTVESAIGQLSSCRSKAASAKDDPQAAAVYERSKKIYRQAVSIYNQTLCKPWNYLPARLMGFHPILRERMRDPRV